MTENKSDLRNVSRDLELMLHTFLNEYQQSGLSDVNTKLYYEFILEPYKKSRQHRYSISMIAKEIMRYGLETKLLINIYYHSLNCLALSDGLDIYGDGFLV